jgi:(2Fe-2S) ferredoxin
VFVCVNERPDGAKGSCAGRGARGVLSALRSALAADPELCAKVAVTECGCLGPCLEGPTMVVYPEGVWYTGVRASDVDELVREHLAAGRTVERLRYRWPDA